MVSCSSSSSPKMKKTSKVSQIQQTVFKKSLIGRQETVFKKAYELSTLCGIEACVICYGSDGELKTWPQDREKVKDLARRYSELSKKQRRRGSVTLSEFLKKINKDDPEKVRRGSQVKYPVWDPRFDNYSGEQLTELIQSLERNRTRIQHRLGVVVEAQRQRKIQNTNMTTQELMMARTMNHLQQHSNQVSILLFNHRSCTFSRIPVSASALNQAQSLAPIPSALAIYPNSNVGNYSSSLGVQETGINGFQNMKMLTYDNNNNNNIIYGVNDFPRQIDQNPKVESYSGLLGVEGYGINEFENTNMYGCNLNAEYYSGLLGWQEPGTNALQNMDMYDYNNDSINANDLSHQLGQFPTPTAAPGFQFGSAGNNIRSLYQI